MLASVSCSPIVRLGLALAIVAAAPRVADAQMPDNVRFPLQSAHPDHMSFCDGVAVYPLAAAVVAVAAAAAGVAADAAAVVAVAGEILQEANATAPWRLVLAEVPEITVLPVAMMVPERIPCTQQVPPAEAFYYIFFFTA